MDLYEELGVGKNASSEEIKKAYRQKASEVHPDKGGTQDEFCRINEAYNVLSDGNKRSHYDKTGCHDMLSEEEKIEQKAKANFMSLFIGIVNKNIDNPDLLYTDLIGKIITEIEKGLYNFNEKIEQHKSRKTTLNDIKNRIKYKGKGDNLLLSTIEQEIYSLEKTVAQIELEIKVGKRIIDHFKPYTFKNKIRKRATTIGTTYTTTTW